MPARIWILIFAPAGAVMSLAIAVEGVTGSTVWVVILAGMGFVLSLLGAVVGYTYSRTSDWDAAAATALLEANRRAAKWQMWTWMSYSPGHQKNVTES
jgi:hypothetical protein